MKNYYNDAHIPHEFQFCLRHFQYFVVQASERPSDEKNPMKGEMWAEFSIRVGEFLMLIFCASFRCLGCAIKINASEWTNSENAISILGASSAV